MNFFAYQEQARKRSKFFVLIFFLCVLGIIAAIYAVVMAILNFQGFFHPVRPITFTQWWDTKVFIYVTLATLLEIGFASLYMRAVLAGGGPGLARWMGGTPLLPNSEDANERKLKNVVEEMAIASGMPVPQIFILKNEHSINAFAAGYTPSDATIGVTRGAIELLSRDELQGVVAHEFSHILNGDMQLNLRLACWVHGILGLATVGYWILRGRRTPAPFFIFGLLLMLIGYIGVFFGKLLKSSVNRQREFLADASSAQFTRNPSGLASALKKIAQIDLGSSIQHHNVETVSHLFFGSATSSKAYWFSSHPPLLERIQRLDPSVRASEIPEEPSTTTEESKASELILRVGNPTIGAKVQADMVGAAGDLLGAKALLYGLLLSEDSLLRERQKQILEKTTSPSLLSEIDRLYPMIQKAGESGRLAVMDSVIPTLRHLSKDQFDLLCRETRELVEADGEFTVSELILLQLSIRHLATSFGKPLKRPIDYRTFEPLREDALLLLSTLAYEGASSEAKARENFSRVAPYLGTPPVSILERSNCSAKKVYESLKRFSRASFTLRKELLEVAGRIISADGQTTPREYEFLRAMGDALDCPIPPNLYSD